MRGGQRFQQVHALGLQRRVDRLDDRVVAEDAVDIVGGLFGAGLDLDHHVEAHGLAHAALGLEGADLDLAQVLGHRDAVARRARGGGLGAFGGVGEGGGKIVGHGPD
jgi:hypothetical protein